MKTNLFALSCLLLGTSMTAHALPFMSTPPQPKQVTIADLTLTKEKGLTPEQLREELKTNVAASTYPDSVTGGSYPSVYTQSNNPNSVTSGNSPNIMTSGNYPNTYTTGSNFSAQNKSEIPTPRIGIE